VAGKRDLGTGRDDRWFAQRQSNRSADQALKRDRRRNTSDAGLSPLARK
jgi:hypothetical protein